MTYVTKNDYRHGTKVYATVDDAAVDFRAINIATVAKFIADTYKAGDYESTLGEYLAKTGAPYFSCLS